MSGFPVRPTRNAFGPKPQNRKPVKNPAQEMDGPTIADLLFWQVSGLSGVGNVTSLYVPVVAGAIDVNNVAHAEAWNPNGDQIAPTQVRTALGIFRVQYAATYPDKDGVAQNTNLIFGLPIPQGLGASGQPTIATITRVDGRTFDVKVWRKDTMAADDASFAVLFW